MHHEDNESVLLRQNNNVLTLIKTIKEFCNPLRDESSQLFNIVTNKIMPSEVQNDVCNRNVLGQDKYEQFVKERINSNSLNLWAPMKKMSLKMCKSASGKPVSIKLKNKIVELKEDRSLFLRIVGRSRPEINLKKTVGTYELSVIPQSLFTVDGTLHHCQKSVLLNILVKLPLVSLPKEDDGLNVSTVAVVDGMAELQAFSKTTAIKNCLDLANSFVAKTIKKFKDYEEVHIVIDRYDVSNSLKTSCREQRLGGMYYFIK